MVHLVPEVTAASLPAGGFRGRIALNDEWVPYKDGEPLVCPKCKSPYWSKPRKNNIKKNNTQHG